MKSVLHILSWAALVGLSALALSTSRVGVLDPTDDFSFTISRAKLRPDSIAWMSEREIRKILVDHLDLFPRSKAPALARHILKLAGQHQFDPAFILSVIQVESGFRIKVVSPAGAIGLMQLMPATAQLVARQNGIPYRDARSLHDPFTNLSLGVAYLAYLREKFRGDSPYFHIAAYNIGPARLEELRARKSFRPVNTRRYFEKIQGGVPRLRYYGSGVIEAGELAGV